MGRLEEQQDARYKKRALLASGGIDPYPARSARTHTLRAVLEAFDDFAKTETQVTVAGRVLTIRLHGNATFLTLADESGEFQVYLTSDALGTEHYQRFVDGADMGDFYEFS